MKLIRANPPPEPPKPGEKIVVLADDPFGVADAVVADVRAQLFAEQSFVFDAWIWNVTKQTFRVNDEGVTWARQEHADAFRTACVLRDGAV